MRKSHFQSSARNYGGGYDEVENSESGSLTVTASVSNGASRYAMPSMPELVYAALLYNGEPPEVEKFVQGTATNEGGKTTLAFSFQRPDKESDLTLEIFAFKADTGEADFSRGKAILVSEPQGNLKIIEGDKINVDEPIALSVNSSSELEGTVELRIKVPEGCSLYKSETNEDGTPIAESDARFVVTGDSSDFTVTQIGDGISAGAYQVTFTVKKGVEIVHIFSEYINVFPGMRTDTWSGLGKDDAKEISQSMISSTVYVRGEGGYYETSPYKNSATASDSNSGSFLSPLATIQKAIDKIIAINDGTSAYTIYVDGTLTQSKKATMATFSALKKELVLTIKALSNEATLDGGARLDENGNVEVGKEGSEKRIIYALSGNVFKLTLENLVIMGANASNSYGGGIYFNSVGGMLTMKSCAIRGNAVAMGGGVFIENGSFTMEDGAISGNTATRGNGVYISPKGTFEMSGTAKIAEGNDVYFEGNATTIAIASDLTAESLIATITPSTYTAGRQVLTEGDGVTIDEDICNKFAVTPQSDGTEWQVALKDDGTTRTGVLIRKKYEIGETGPGGGTVCYYDPNGFTVNGKTCYYLECSKEQLGTMTWCPCFFSYCDVTLSNDIGAGYANTQAILNHSKHASATATNCAAKACAEYGTGTPTAGEWFLPNQVEAAEINKGVALASDETLWLSQASSTISISDARFITLKSDSTNIPYNESKKKSLGVRAVRVF